MVTIATNTARTLLQIGEVARLVGVTTKTIRHYHKLGLLPEPDDLRAITACTTRCTY